MKKKTLPLIGDQFSIKSTPPRSAPSMIPKRIQGKTEVRVKSEPTIICRNGSGDSGFLDRGESKSFAESSNATPYPACPCDDDSTRLNVQVIQRTVGTNYSVNDLSEYFYLMHNYYERQLKI